jgi:hypothetical protein
MVRLVEDKIQDSRSEISIFDRVMTSLIEQRPGESKVMF